MKKENTTKIVKMRYSVEWPTEFGSHPRVVADADGEWESFEEAVNIAFLDLEQAYLDQVNFLEALYGEHRTINVLGI